MVIPALNWNPGDWRWGPGCNEAQDWCRVRQVTRRPVTAILVGAGNRGMGYSNYALHNPDELRIIGVAEPSDRRRTIAAETFEIPPEMCFGSAEEMAERPRMADAVINGTMEMEHVSTAIPLMAAGYDMLLEKPFATSEPDMWRLVRASREHGAS